MKFPIKVEKHDDKWFVEISSTISNFIPKKELPLKVKFLNTYNKVVEWSINLEPDTWCSYSLRNNDVEITTKSNRIIKKVPSGPFFNDLIEDVFYTCVVGNNLKNGIVAGAGRGSYGEWLDAVIENKTKALLIEPQSKEYKVLVDSFSKYPNVKFLNKGVSKQKETREFFIYINQIGLSSLDKNTLLDRKIEENHITKINVECESLSYLLEQEKYDWLRLDVESLDCDLIQSLRPQHFDTLKYIQYEHLNIPEEKIKQTDGFLESLGYKIYKINIDTICLKN
tara:strand:+ start:294 stop:1139 length:846 start_codon:yes stop_codon:yes gene_type:complete